MHWGQFAAAFAAETGPVRNPTTTTFRAEANRPYLRVANVYEDRLDIEQMEAFCPGVTRRSLQRDLKDLIDKQILQSHGEARAIRYSLQIKGL